jgi:hypothetical protein
MKLIAKVSGLGVFALGAAIGLAGCAESNDAAAVKSPTGGKSGAGVVPAGTPRSSADAAAAQQANNPMTSKDYPK